MQMGIIILKSLLFNLIFNPDGIFDEMYKIIGKRWETKFKIGISGNIVLIAFSILCFLSLNFKFLDSSSFLMF